MLYHLARRWSLLRGHDALRAAARLLGEADNSVETAVALFFSSNPSAPAAAQQAPPSPRSQLCSIIGPPMTQARAARLIRSAGSVQAAIDRHYATEGALALPPCVAR
jgi:hypothetical protein